MAFKKNEVNAISEWLIIEFSNLIIVENLFLVGSILDKPLKEVNDIDIVQLLKKCTKDDLIKHSKNVDSIKKMFLTVFGKSLHITSFTQNELIAYQNFMRINQEIKII